MEMKVIICGGRSFCDAERAGALLDKHLGGGSLSLVIEGGARGADSIGRRWARKRGIPVKTVEANWDRYGKRAGMIRNIQMADLKPDAVVAFPGGKGTRNMIDIARFRRIPIRFFLWPEGEVEKIQAEPVNISKWTL